MYNDIKNMYAEFEKHIISFCKEPYLDQYNSYIENFIQTHSTRDNVSKLVYGPEVIINKLEGLRLKPLKKSYDKLSSLVTDTSHYFEDTLRQKAKNILDILYNILYSHAILDVMTDMIMIPAVANSPKNYDLQNVISCTEVLASSYASQYKLLLMKASLNVKSADNIDKMNASVTNLKKLGLSHKERAGSVHLIV